VDKKNSARGDGEEKVKIRRRRVEFKDWWDIGCTRRKRRVMRVYKL